MIRPALVALFLAPALAGLPVRAATVYVASQQGAQVTRVEAGAVVGHATVAEAPATVAAGGGSVFLSHPDGHAITVTDAATGVVLRRLPYRGQAFGLAASADGRTLFVADWSGHRVDRLSAADGTVEASAETGRDPAHITLDRAGRLYVADRESHQISVFETERMTRLATISVGTAPFALALSPDERRLYVGNVRSNDLTVIDTQALKPLTTVPVGPMPYGVSVSPDGARVLVTNQQAGTVTVLDAGTLAIAATVGVGRYPEGIVIEDGRAYVANWFSDSVSVLDLATLKEVARLPVAEGPRSLAVAAAAKEILR
ncbi:YncE family protein [Methylobacterium sp. R2-1]|uniref:YVTN family beta-propeller repeat protein n=1 Tax=Methylobacterium sp. R2-1 TaxID=2587064 RepID=UPI00160C5CAB|nr:YncE family protein [Methylobacterium sp. R2-1]MBB2962106.1 YVTN family beta-propeller protein [Methylobacterium sp. R2-1]